VRARLDLLNRLLIKEAEVLELGSKIQSQVQSEVGKNQREYFLREQMKAIQKELGEGDDQTKEVEELREKIEGLSRRGQGKPQDDDAGSAVSELQGNFLLKEAQITFRKLSFGVTGAKVDLAGTYGLRDERLDFHGTLRLQAKLSQTMTGVKSFLLKPFDPFFRKNGATVLPIKVTGTRDQPSFGLELRRKKDEAKNTAGD